MPEWAIWVIVAAVFAVGEIATFTLFLGPIALAALLAALVSLTGAPIELQVVAFVLGSIAALLLLRPIARRYVHTPAQLRTGTQALVGEQAVVLERVDGAGGTVKLKGEVWTARAYDGEAVLEPGERVLVLDIDGATALVSS